ncbi:PAS domain S-box protein [Geomobilimonas luticola]|uniref:histidine kinase n=1 Tax=Geomobilimonas luticola TaxID=1114878 RepID=A0ABS5SEL5_9BACT|nr:PAS domain S-box protein [Geomobilimonas luticola]MBT0653056.1 PAS domain S-box protein [Geomobilimonas luticola]
MKDLSMKTKMALAVSLMFVVVIVLLAWGALYYQEQSLGKAISRQQYALVSSLAANIDDKLALAHNALITAARELPPETVRSSDRAQHFLDARILLLSVFDNGLFLISRDGKLIAESPFLPGRRELDLTSQEYFRQTIATGKPCISKPYTSSRTPGHPAIFLSAPVFDRQGRLTGILGGSFDLWGRNFLQDLSRTRYGDASYFYLTDRDRTIIVHPDRNRILTRMSPGATPLYEKALAGFEGSEETISSQGIRVISSVRHLRTAGWILAANYPSAEAYAPLKTTRHYFLLATLVLTIAVLAIVWLLMKRLTAPLATFTRHVESLPADFGHHHLLEIDSSDEIGVMAQAFNQMVSELETQQTVNESRLKTLLRLNEMTSSSLKEIADLALEETVRLTRSTIGYLAFVNDDESVLTMYSWSRAAMQECAISDKPREYPLSGTGLWGEAVRQRRPVITNDYTAPNPCKKGYPPGHVEVRRHMNAPIFDGERIVIVAGVGNKDEEYDETDVHQLTLLMQGMWRLMQHRRAEEALREEKEKFSLAFQAVPSALVIATLADGKYLEVNEAFERMMEYRRDEVIGRCSLGLDIWENREERAMVIRKLAEGEKVRNQEIGFRSKSGAIITGLYSAEIISIGAERCLLSLVNDITARKKAEEELRRSEERYRSLYNETPVMLHSIDHDGLLVSVSNYWLDTLGYERSEVIGRKTTEFMTDASRQYAEDVVLPEFFRTGSCKDIAYRFVKKNGEIMDVLLSAIAERNDEGEVVRSLAVMTDVTDRKRAQEEIEKLNTDLMARAMELENANREMETFSYSVSHDLRKPLTVISGYCQVIREVCGDHLKEECLGYLQEVQSGAVRMNELIDALLKLSCLTRSELHRETVDLSSIAHTVAAELTLTAPDRRVTFRIADGISVNGDAKLLRVVLENLFGNAWKYTANREEAVIELGVIDIDGTAACFVRDNGTGFNMADAEKLFLPFQRLPGAGEFKGHGIGLATVERIIRRHGGRIWAEGEPDKGATFWFAL